jgi:hypothetical protein
VTDPATHEPTRPPSGESRRGRRSTHRRWWYRFRTTFVIGAAFAVLVPVALELTPASWLEATPVGDARSVDTAIVLGFGFERAPDGTMQPGLTNRFLLDWTLHEYPNLTTLFVQEGVWTAACPQAVRTCRIGQVTLHRIDRHDDRVDLHTNAIAICTIERMLAFGKRKAILVAQPIQLGRAVGDFDGARRDRCEDCEIVVPEVPDAPYDPHSSQVRTRAEWLYKPIDILAYVHDRTPLAADAPPTCPMPMPAGE